ncbi:hypothetical protein LRY58_03825 [Candidatus Woesebacteria bacterium]|nr:hypothetical protein [Candidatus Woesebacteria bacterium]
MGEFNGPNMDPNELQSLPVVSVEEDTDFQESLSDAETQQRITRITALQDIAGQASDLAQETKALEEALRAENASEGEISDRLTRATIAQISSFSETITRVAPTIPRTVQDEVLQKELPGFSNRLVLGFAAVRDGLRRGKDYLSAIFGKKDAKSTQEYESASESFQFFLDQLSNMFTDMYTHMNFAAEDGTEKDEILKRLESSRLLLLPLALLKWLRGISVKESFAELQSFFWWNFSGAGAERNGRLPENEKRMDEFLSSDASSHLSEGIHDRETIQRLEQCTFSEQLAMRLIAQLEWYANDKNVIRHKLFDVDKETNRVEKSIRVAFRKDGRLFQIEFPVEEIRAKTQPETKSQFIQELAQMLEGILDGSLNTAKDAYRFSAPAQEQVYHQAHKGRDHLDSMAELFGQQDITFVLDPELAEGNALESVGARKDAITLGSATRTTYIPEVRRRAAGSVSSTDQYTIVGEWSVAAHSWFGGKDAWEAQEAQMRSVQQMVEQYLQAKQQSSEQLAGPNTYSEKLQAVRSRDVIEVLNKMQKGEKNKWENLLSHEYEQYRSMPEQWYTRFVIPKEKMLEWNDRITNIRLHGISVTGPDLLNPAVLLAAEGKVPTIQGVAAGEIDQVFQVGNKQHLLKVDSLEVIPVPGLPQMMYDACKKFFDDFDTSVFTLQLREILETKIGHYRESKERAKNFQSWPSFMITLLSGLGWSGMREMVSEISKKVMKENGQSAIRYIEGLWGILSVLGFPRSFPDTVTGPIQGSFASANTSAHTPSTRDEQNGFFVGAIGTQQTVAYKEGENGEFEHQIEGMSITQRWRPDQVLFLLEEYISNKTLGYDRKKEIFAHQQSVLEALRATIALPENRGEKSMYDPQKFSQVLHENLQRSQVQYPEVVVNAVLDEIDAFIQEASQMYLKRIQKSMDFLLRVLDGMGKDDLKEMRERNSTREYILEQMKTQIIPGTEDDPEKKKAVIAAFTKAIATKDEPGNIDQRIYMAEILGIQLIQAKKKDNDEPVFEEQKAVFEVAQWIDQQVQVFQQQT